MLSIGWMQELIMECLLVSDLRSSLSIAAEHQGNLIGSLSHKMHCKTNTSQDQNDMSEYICCHAGNC